jgi:hypothetical protein
METDNSVLSPSPNCTSGDRLQSDNMYLLLWTGCDVVIGVLVGLLVLAVTMETLQGDIARNEDKIWWFCDAGGM